MGRTGRAIPAVCALACLTANGSAVGGGDPSFRTTRLSGPSPANRMREPNVAVDPIDPSHIVVTALSRTKQEAFAFTWASMDGGRSWTRGFLKPAFPRYDIASDPSLAFGPDCRVYFTHLDFGDFKTASTLKDGQWLKEGGLGFQRSGDCGKTFQPSRLADNTADGRQADKDWLAVDSSPSSKFRGSVYVFWSYIGSLVDKSDEATDIRFAYTRDGGRTFSPPRQLSRNGYVVQTVVRPDGTLDAIWEERRWNSRKIWHVSSFDGGETFSAPRLVVGVPEPGVLDWPVLAATGPDTLVAGWCQRADGSRTGRLESRIFTAVFRDGAWSAPQALEPDLPGGSFVSIPALAATDDAAWLLAYRVDPATTRVVLYRAALPSHRFVQHSILGTRQFGTKQFCPGWLDCFEEDPAADPKTEVEQFFPGDYVGLSGAKRRLAAAYILPRDDDRRVDSTHTLYVHVLDE
jgi:hypothetical protein